MERFIAVVSGDSMWPTYNEGQRLVCESSKELLVVGAVIVFQNPLHSAVKAIKRVVSIEQDLIFVEGDHPDPTSSDDSHNFGKIPRSSVLGVVVDDAP